MIKKLCKLTISVHVREPHISSSDILKPFVWLKYGLNDSKYTDAGKWDPFRDWGAHEIGNSAFSQPEGYENTQNWIKFMTPTDVSRPLHLQMSEDLGTSLHTSITNVR